MTASSAPSRPLEPPRIAAVEPLLEARGLMLRYGRIPAVDDVDVTVYPSEILGIVGESGSGKSSLLRLLNLQELPARGAYRLHVPGCPPGNLFELDRFARRDLRTQQIGIVYQHPHLGLRMRNSSSGNVAERLLQFGERRYETLRDKARASLAGSEFPLQRMDDPPSHLSGGMQQRVQLAKAIALEPKLLLLDEPTSGLDVSVQAKVLDTLKRLQRETRVTMVLVSHDLGVIRTLADRVIIMRRGKILETGLTDQVLEDPQAAYTQQLVHAKL